MPPRLPPRLPPDASRLPSNPTSWTGLLPTRATDHLSPDTSQSQRYSHPYEASIGINDPRSSSTQSLRPVESPGELKRKLLLVYIHGFLGAETSFKSFPAHVHSLLTIALIESHVVHTKIYPRYQSRRKISFARDDFSHWLSPHESPSTDVILLGHSLGGILGAEVVLVQAQNSQLFRHRILGLVGFDTPFLGLHPGVVGTGIASIFRKSSEDKPTSLQAMASQNRSEVFDASEDDPNYNPEYLNDVKLPVRKNKFDRAWYFWNKHADNIGKAAKSYVKSHLEFGGCLADYPGLRRRYEAIRALEDVDMLGYQQESGSNPRRRVRFVNYYTASSGRPKNQGLEDQMVHSITEADTEGFRRSSSALAVPEASQSTPRISLEEHRDGEVIDKTAKLGSDDNPDHAFEAVPISDTLLNEAGTVDHPPNERLISNQHKANLGQNLGAWETLELSTTHQSSKQHENFVGIEESRNIESRAMNNNISMAAVDHHESELNDRIECQQRNTSLSIKNSEHSSQQAASVRSDFSSQKKLKKDRKFCTLPFKDKLNETDPTWEKVYMNGVDEVVAHTSLFNFGETYEKLVGDTSERITKWVHEDANIRTILAE